MAITTFNVSLFFHITFVIVWSFTIPIMALVERASRKASSTEDKFNILRMSSINGKISFISAILVFVTGAIMTTILDAWAPEDSFWLVTKQTIWLVLLIGAVVLMRPLDKKINTMMDEGKPVEEVMDQYKKMKIFSHILTTLIFINILLATTKPF